MQVQRGEIYWACLDPVFGREMGGFKMRPVIVVSINDLNYRTRLVTVVPGTTSARQRNLENVVTVEPDENNGLRKTGYFQCHQMRAIDQGRLIRGPTGRLAREKFEQIERAVAFSLGLSLERGT